MLIDLVSRGGNLLLDIGPTMITGMRPSAARRRKRKPAPLRSG